MRALILAAGRGSRMGAATGGRPKGMVPLRGRPLLAWQLDTLQSLGIDEIAIVRGYRGESLPFHVTYFENKRWNETNMVGSLACAEPWLRAAPTIVSYADIVYAPDAVRRLGAEAADVAITYDTRWLELWRRRFEDPLTDAETFRVDSAGRLLEIGGRASSLDEIGGQYMGLVKLTPRGAMRLLECYRALAPDERDRLDMTALLALALAAGDEVRAVPFDGWWCEVDTEADLRLAEEFVEPAQPS